MLVQKLLRAASTPYFAMLELWLCQGVLNDPYAEFMVQEDKVSLPRGISGCWILQLPSAGAAQSTGKRSVSRPRMVQSVGHDSINDRDESAYWTDRYKLRMRHSSSGSVFQSAEPAPDMPAFLEPCKDTILTTGDQSREGGFASRPTGRRLQL